VYFKTIGNQTITEPVFDRCPDCSPTGLTREEVEALEAGAHWTTERGRFSTELADGMEKSSLAIDAAGAAEVTAYVGKLRAEALMHNTHATTLRNLAARK
jgi:hypothetical protein